jgi:DNA-directed RNA polymerase subunit H (RpoH/RPB5)
MPNDYENRVLSRRNAHQLSAEEYQKILEQGKTQMTQLPSIPFNPDF